MRKPTKETVANLGSNVKYQQKLTTTAILLFCRRFFGILAVMTSKAKINRRTKPAGIKV